MTPKLLELTYFGNPILRQVAKKIEVEEINTQKIKQLIADIKFTCQQKQLGVGLAAPQVGDSLALSVIAIKPTPNRPELTPFEQVIINPEYQGIGGAKEEWEGCMSCSFDSEVLFAKVPRYQKIEATWFDEFGESHQQALEGFIAQVFQHETDHLNGILFVDLVKDTHSYMLAREYRARILGLN